MEFSSGRKKRKKVDPVTFIDVMVVLLIFFMLATTFSAEEAISVSVAPSEGKAAGRGAGGETAIPALEVFQDRLILNGMVVSERDLGAKLAGTPALRLIAKEGADLQKYVNALDAARMAGVGSVAVE